MINATPVREDEELREPTVEQLMGKVRRLQQVQTETYQLEGIHKGKEDVYRKLQVQCEESEQDSDRQLKNNKASEELLERYRCEIQELRLKHRKQRMRFENQLQLLIEQHKKLHAVFAPERLPDELKNAENTKAQLLSAEQQKSVQLQTLDEELEKVKNKQVEEEE
ncbi:synaptonemal complex central element protein 1 isoform 2-T2 [Menidia menidia]